MSDAGAGAPALSIRDLSISFDRSGGPVRVVEGVSCDVWPGETLGVVGESGCGKTLTALAVLGLLPPGARVTSGEVRLAGQDVLRLDRSAMRRLRGAQVAMVFQDPMSALHPAHPILSQVTEAVRVHAIDLSVEAARARALDLLDMVGVPHARSRAQAYPHEWSGGMRQRAMIAMAVAHHPQVLIADEPTTALDVTVQAQVLDVLRMIQREYGLAIVLISHDLGIIAEMADRVAVMYAGRVVESASAEDLFARPRHPYSAGLLAGLPRVDAEGGRLQAIAGSPPSLAALPSGCAFHPRCPLRQGRERCVIELPMLGSSDDAGEGFPHHAACHYAGEVVPSVAAEAP